MKAFLNILVFFLVLNCGGEKEPILGETEFQRNLNNEFKDASKSPLKLKDLKNFNGLEFFDVDSSYIVTAKLQRTPDSEWFNMKTTTDRITEERVYGIINFNLIGNTYSLNIYQGKESLNTEGMENYLFLPFLDETNGESTYGGGRYIDLSIPQTEELVINFNEAYNPYCVYNEKYSCPLVPRENYIPIRIEAGVKMFGKKSLK